MFAHNLETVPRIFKQIRPAFTYEKSLRVLSMAREAELVTKSNLILGMGEEDHEVEQAIGDLHDAGCDILTITQYLRPSKLHHPIDRWVKPEEFVHWSDVAQDMGFKGVMAGPLVRSSYRAGRLWATAMKKWGRPIPEHLQHLADAADTRPPGGRLAGRAQRGAAPARRILTPWPARKRAVDTPKKPGRLAQVRQVFTAARKARPHDPVVDAAGLPRRSWSASASACSSATGSTPFSYHPWPCSRPRWC